MMAHSPHRRRKGCGLCKPWKHRGLGRASRETSGDLFAVEGHI